MRAGAAGDRRVLGARRFLQYGHEENIMKKYVCDVCGWVYDPAVGYPAEGIEPGTSFEDLPDDFICPECGAGKDSFSPQD